MNFLFLFLEFILVILRKIIVFYFGDFISRTENNCVMFLKFFIFIQRDAVMPSNN